MLYAVTSDAIKFKAKSWIDVFGGHSAKAVGSLINNALKHSLYALMLYGSLVSLCFCVALALASSWLGRAFEARARPRDRAPWPRRRDDGYTTVTRRLHDGYTTVTFRAADSIALLRPP